MTIRQQQFIFLVLSSITAVYFSVKIGKGEWFLPILLCLGGFFILAIILTRVNSIGLVLSFLIIGYVIGNRGFAQITPLWNLPIFFGELALFFTGVYLICFILINKEIPFRLNALGILLLIWVAYGSLRILFDVKSYGIVALRDFATVYYSLYFFVVQPLANDLRSWRFFNRVLGLAIIVMIPIFPLFKQYPDFFVYSLIFDGVPIIYYKGDLASAAFAIGFFYFYTKYLKSYSFPYIFIASICFLMVVYSISRAVWVGFAFGLMILMWSRFYKVFIHLTVISILALIPYSVIIINSDEEVSETKIYSVYEHAMSLLDVNGSGTYRNSDSRNTGSNNLYRLTWWENVLSETWSKGPLLGLGFGYDLAYNFMWDYYTSNEPSDTRSPHSIVVTVLGRMGLFGFILFALVIGEMFRNTRRVILHTRRNGIATDALCYWCMVWVLFATSCFGVVLEGPMGAILFWTLLGCAQNIEGKEERENSGSINPDIAKEDIHGLSLPAPGY